MSPPGIQKSWKKLVGNTKDYWSRVAREPRSPDSTNGGPERAQTDEGLRVERDKADEALAERQGAINADADLTVHRARVNADATVDAARNKADQGQNRPATPVEQRAITEQRALEDEALRDERALADESISREREQTARVLTRLLPLEREATDRYLLTERARSDDSLANRDDFLGIVAHDLRDLLGGVVLSAELLAKMAPASGSAEPILAETTRLRRYAARMNRLIGDLVDTASIDAGRLAMTPAPGDVDLLIAEAADRFRAAAAAKRISLELETVERPLMSAFDYDRILQVLANTISNAIKFTPEGGRVTIRCERAANELRFSISDTGPGIPADALENIFERFWQVGKNDRRGLGLGLYLSRCIVEAHGGKIWAESAPGEGTRICFTLPA